MTGGVSPAPRLVKELDFKVIEEKWLTIKLKDGSVIKFKPVLVRVFETDAKDPLTGEPVHGFEGQNVVTVRSPENLRGPPSEHIPLVHDALKMPKEEVEVVEIIDPGWNLYELENGKKIKTKAVITSVYKIKDVFDRYGNPYYVVMSQMVVGSSSIRLPDTYFDHEFIGGRVVVYLEYLPSPNMVFELVCPQPISPQFLLIRQLLTKFQQAYPLLVWKTQETMVQVLRRITPIRVKLSEDVLTPIEEGLFARKTADGKIEIFEVIE